MPRGGRQLVWPALTGRVRWLRRWHMNEVMLSNTDTHKRALIKCELALYTEFLAALATWVAAVLVMVADALRVTLLAERTCAFISG